MAKSSKSEKKPALVQAKLVQDKKASEKLAVVQENKKSSEAPLWGTTDFPS